MRVAALLLFLWGTTANAFLHTQPTFSSGRLSVAGVVEKRQAAFRLLFFPQNQSSFDVGAEEVTDTNAAAAAARFHSQKHRKKNAWRRQFQKGGDIGKELFLENSKENLALVEFLETTSSRSSTTRAVWAKQLATPTILEENGTALASVIAESLVNNDTMVKALMTVSQEAVNAMLAKDANNNVSLHIDTIDVSDTHLAVESSFASLDTSDTPQRHNKMVEAPSVRKILKFAIPAIGVWLCDPLLSLIDTSAVGMLAGTVPQAALTPACAVTDYAALLIAFVFTATTNLVAAAKETDRGVPGYPKMTKSLVGSLQLSTYVGAILGTFLFVYARPLVQAIVGSASGVQPAVLDAATIYVRIRALGMPAAAQIGSAQAACLGMHDIPSQFMVLASAALVNLVADMVMVGHPNVWIGGAAGAAWATIFSQYTAVACFFHLLCRKPKVKLAHQKRKPLINLSSLDPLLKWTRKSNRNDEKLQPTVASNCRKTVSQVYFASTDRESGVDKAREESFSVRGFLAGRFRMVDLIKLPSLDTIKRFWPYCLPVTFAQIGRVSGYIAMTYVVGSSMGTLAMAAQQIVASLVFCLFPVSDSLSLTGQAFVPPIMEKTPSPGRSAALRQTMINLSKAAGIMGLFSAVLFAFTPLISGYLTADPLVAQMVNGLVPLLALSFPIYALVMAFEGFLLGQKDLGFQGKMYTSWCFIVPYFMLKAKGQHINAVWTVLFGYQVVRFLSWAGRALLLQKRAEQEVEQLMQFA